MGGSGASGPSGRSSSGPPTLMIPPGIGSLGGLLAALGGGAGGGGGPLRQAAIGGSQQTSSPAAGGGMIRGMSGATMLFFDALTGECNGGAHPCA